MKLRILGCDGGRGLGYENTTFMINDHILIDAGTIQSQLTLEEALKITDIFLTHTHLDHIIDLPFLMDATFCGRDKPLRIHGTKESLDSMMENIFNNKIWPDFSKLPTEESGQFELVYIEPNQEYQVGDVTLMPIAVDHTVPTVGFRVSDENASFVFSGDTGPTESIWQAANTAKNLKAVIVDLSFPKSEQAIAKLSKHMTATDVEEQLTKLEKDCDVYVFHFKVGLEDVLKGEVKDIQHHGKPVLALRDFKEIQF